MHIIRRFIRCDSGATSIEYGLIAALIAVILVGALSTVGSRLNVKFGKVSNSLS